MTDLRTAAQQALKSLRGYRREIGCEQPCDAERALEAALEQPEQEPVAWIRADGMKAMVADEKAAWIEAGQPDLIEDYNVPAYNHPARREWRGLTEEEVINLSDLRGGCYGTTDFARAIEAALKERNA